MRILITAGGTAEKIDEVRSITNHSTGSLGKELAAAFSQRPNTQIDYIVARSAVKPAATENLRLFPISDTRELADTLTRLMTENRYDAVIHSMAVSDFTPEVSLDEDRFLQLLNTIDGPITTENFQAALSAASTPTEKKISSKTDHLIMVLKQNPKIISQIKALQPETKLVGFKLLVGVSKEELLEVAHATLTKNQADYVFANDLESIHDGAHHGYLINEQGIVGEADDKAAIAQLIAAVLTKGAE